MQQKIIFSLEGIQINSTQIIANEQIFALNELTAVMHGQIEPTHAFSSFCVFMGSILMTLEDAFIIVGGFSLFLGLIAFFTAKTIYTVIIETVTGEHHAFASENRDAVDSAIRAINTAVIDLENTRKL